MIWDRSHALRVQERDTEPVGDSQTTVNFFQQLLAVAVLTVRSTTRNRVFQYILALILLTGVGLPLVVTGDGTVQGYARVSIDYSLKLVTFILAVTSIWVAVAASSGEIAEKQIHLVVTKPVSHSAIWLGKWFGLLAISAAFLVIAVTCISAAIRWHLRPSTLPPGKSNVTADDVFTAKTVVEPDKSDLQRAIQSRADELAVGMNTGRLARARLLETAGREVTRRESTVPPGDSRRWIFNLDRQINDHPLTLRFVMSSPRQLELEPVTVQWRFHDAAGETGAWQSVTVFAGQPNSIPVSQGCKSGRLIAEFINSQTNPPATVAFSRSSGVTLMAKTGSFEGNLARALILILCQLAVLGALGLTLGCMFSMPVAVFSACAVIAAFNLSSMLTADDIVQPRHHDTGQTMTETLRLARLKAVNAVLAPIRRYDPARQLQQSELIPWSLVAEAIAVDAILYSGLFCIAGVFVLKRRQLGMPT